MFVVSEKQEKPVVIVLAGFFLFGAGWFFVRKGMLLSYLLFFISVLFILMGIFKLIRIKIHLRKVGSE